MLEFVNFMLIWCNLEYNGVDLLFAQLICIGVCIIVDFDESKIVLLLVRAVHGSVRVGFVPNPEPTRRNRVKCLTTRCRPSTTSGRVGSVSGG